MYVVWLRLWVFIKRFLFWSHLLPKPAIKNAYMGVGPEGVCAYWHAGLLPQVEADVIRSFKTPIVRVGISDVAQAKAVVDNITALYGTDTIKIVFLVETMDAALVNSLGQYLTTVKPACVVAVELGNEIDLTDAKPEAFGDFVIAGYHALRTFGWTGDIIMGGISRVRPDTLKWLKKAIQEINSWMPTDLIIGIHRYSINNDALIPQDGYVDRIEECAAILKVADGNPIAITEYGYPYLDGSTDADMTKILRSIDTDAVYWRALGAKYVFWYQWTDGPSNTPIDRFGLKTISGEYRPTLKKIASGL
jgi:hypothetical protein